MRRGEILTLTPDAFRDRHVLLEGDLTKSGKPRAIPLPPELDPKHFPHGINPTALTKQFEKTRARIGLGGVWFHDLRRTYATWLHQNGADLAAIRDLLGHSDISMTSRYLGVTSSDLKAAVRFLPRLGR